MRLYVLQNLYGLSDERTVAEGYGQPSSVKILRGGDCGDRVADIASTNVHDVTMVPELLNGEEETISTVGMAALHLSIVPGSIGANELVANSQLSSRCLNEGFQIALAIGKAICELKTIIGLNTLDGNAFAGKMLDDIA